MATPVSVLSNLALQPSSTPSTGGTDDPRLGDFVQRVSLDSFLAMSDRLESGGGGAVSPISGILRRPHQRPAVVLTGFPHDEGCRRNGGRVGAAKGPKVVREFVQKLGTVDNPETDIDLSKNIDAYDVGDVAEGESSLEAAHAALERHVRQLLTAGPHVVPFVVGGSNDQSWPNASALMSALGHGRIGVVNIDAHLDVRPLKDGQAHSGSSFRQLLSDERFAGALAEADTDGRPPLQFVEFGAQGSQCARAHADFVTRTHRQRIDWLSDVRQRAGLHPPPALGQHGFAAPVLHQHGVGAVFEHVLEQELTGDALFVSFDLDSVIGSDAPGVSCPGTVGFTAQEALDMCFVAGRNPRVRLFDLSEFNPAVDDFRTGRLVANMFYYFTMGVAQREIDRLRNKH